MSEGQEQGTEDGKGQMSEVGCQRSGRDRSREGTEVRGRRSEVRGQRTEDLVMSDVSWQANTLKLLHCTGEIF